MAWRGLAGKHVATLAPPPNFSGDLYSIPPFRRGTIFVKLSIVFRWGRWAYQEFSMTFVAGMGTIDAANPITTVPMASFWDANFCSFSTVKATSCFVFWVITSRVDLTVAAMPVTFAIITITGIQALVPLVKIVSHYHTSFIEIAFVKVGCSLIEVRVKFWTGEF